MLLEAKHSPPLRPDKNQLLRLPLGSVASEKCREGGRTASELSQVRGIQGRRKPGTHDTGPSVRMQTPVGAPALESPPRAERACTQPVEKELPCRGSSRSRSWGSWPLLSPLRPTRAERTGVDSPG